MRVDAIFAAIGRSAVRFSRPVIAVWAARAIAAALLPSLFIPALPARAAARPQPR